MEAIDIKEQNVVKINKELEVNEDGFQMEGKDKMEEKVIIS